MGYCIDFILANINYKQVNNYIGYFDFISISELKVEIFEKDKIETLFKLSINSEEI